MAAVFLAGARLRHRWKTARILALATFLLAVFILASNFGPPDSGAFPWVVPLWRAGNPVARLGAASLVAALLVMAWRAATTARVAKTLLLVASPFVAVTFGRAAFTVVTRDPDRTLADRAASAPLVPSAVEPRHVVVLLFDAMGRDAVFDRRSARVELKAFDRLRAESVDAIAVSEAGTDTRTAVPGFLSGVQPLAANPRGPLDLELRFPGGRVESWPSLPNVFREAHALGQPTTAVGWYHPYCRVLGPDIDSCTWRQGDTAGGRFDPGLAAAVGANLRSLLPYTVYRDRHLRSYQSLLGEARAAVLRPGLVFVHFNIPHLPVIRDASGQLTRFRPGGYEDQLELADATLGELRAVMEEAGVWDGTMVVVTSDHPCHLNICLGSRSDHRVPLLIKAPGARGGRSYDREISAATGFSLLRAGLAGELPDPEAIVRWLDANAVAPTVEPIPPEE